MPTCATYITAGCEVFDLLAMLLMVTPTLHYLRHEMAAVRAEKSVHPTLKEVDSAFRRWLNSAYFRYTAWGAVIGILSQIFKAALALYSLY